jgi:predicted nucleic acid-binding Zn ribbon protein
MTENEQIKVCPLCAETIKAAAKICPHCRTWQKKWSFQNPQTMQSIGAIISLIVIIVVLMGLGYFFQHLIGPKRDFAAYQSQIVVVNSEASFRMSDSNLMVDVVGIVTNQTDFAWKNVGLEARLFDKEGKLIDVIQADNSSYSGIVILPHAEAGFKIHSRATKNESDYAAHKVFIGTGEDFNAWP